MLDRGFTEVELREMLEEAESYEPDIVEGRFVVETRHRRKRWQVIVEPDTVARRLVVVTAYAAGR
jgi:hypothetical protein